MIKPHQIYPQWAPAKPQHEFMKPNAWLGAYYKLRDGDEAAQRNLAKLRGKQTPTRGNFIMKTMDAREEKRISAAEPWRTMPWRVGTYVEVDHTAKRDDAIERVVGIVINIRRKGLQSSFRLLGHVDGVSVEYQFLAFSPLVTNVTVKQASAWRDKNPFLVKLREQAHKLNYPAATRLPKRVIKEEIDPKKLSGRSRGEQR